MKRDYTISFHFILFRKQVARMLKSQPSTPLTGCPRISEIAHMVDSMDFVVLFDTLVSHHVHEPVHKKNKTKPEKDKEEEEEAEGKPSLLEQWFQQRNMPVSFQEYVKTNVGKQLVSFSEFCNAARGSAY